MKKFKDFLNEAKQFKKGDKVKVKNPKKYDSMAKDDTTGEIIGMMNKTTAMVKVGSGQMNVDVSDIIAEANRFASNDQEFTKLSKMTSEVKEGWRDIRRAAKKQNIEQRVLDQIGDKVEDAIMDLNKALKDAQDVLKKLED